MTSDGLFRQQALDGQRDKLAGQTVRILPLSIGMMTILAIAGAISLVTFAFLGQYTRKEHVSGFVVPEKGLTKITSDRFGILREAYVRDGQEVKRGQILFLIELEHGVGAEHSSEANSLYLMKQRRDSLSAEQARQVIVDKLAVRQMIGKAGSLSAELDSLTSVFALQENRVKSAAAQVARYEQLAATNYVSVLQVEQQRDAYFAQVAKLNELRRSQMALKRELADTREVIAASTFTSQNRQQSVLRDMREVEQQMNEGEGKRSLTIKSPVQGIVTSQLIKPGQYVNASTTLASIIPSNSELQAVLLIPTRAIGFIRPGQPVAVRYDAFPYQRFGSQPGTVLQIDQAVLSKEDTSLPVTVSGSSYRVIVKLKRQDVVAYGRATPLRPGMLLEADISIERRRLIDWLLDPVYSVTGRI